jgi:hypothetical protein
MARLAGIFGGLGKLLLVKSPHISPNGVNRRSQVTLKNDYILISTQ